MQAITTATRCSIRLKATSRRFTPSDCSTPAIPAALLESELFGHERGAFTGAVAQAMGRFQAADRGTLFLDEIGDLPLDLQPKLLRVLQEQQFERLGGSRTVQVNVRVIAATNQDLWRMVQERTFRADLYYRLNVFPITLPPLRERADDIPLLAAHFVRKFAERQGKSISHIPEDVMEVLKSHHWPGNIRQLENAVFRAVVLTETDAVGLDEFPQITALAGNGGAAPCSAHPSLSLGRKTQRPCLLGLSPTPSGRTSWQLWMKQIGSLAGIVVQPPDLTCPGLL